jgi:glucose-1-phosphate thymidylyltransferase
VLQEVQVHRERSVKREVIGVIPAGGQGIRISPLPCSKEIYPIGFDESREMRPKVACHYLLEKMRAASITEAFIVLREGKWDIPAYLQDGKMLGMNLAYLIMDAPFGVPYTIDQAFPFVQDVIIAFGFPDIFFEQDDVFVKLLNRLRLQDCDVVLGLFPSDRPDKADMVDIDPEGKIRNIVIKPQQTELSLTWGVAVWTPIFTKFMHRYVEEIRLFAEQHKELFIGEVVQAAIDDGLSVEAIHVSDTPYIDIGTPDDLLRATKRLIARIEKNH